MMVDVNEATFHILLRVDCEASSRPIQDLAMGERSVRGLMARCEQEDLRCSFAVIPSDLEAQPQLYREAAAGGHEVGLHVHPAEDGYEEFLGVYGPERQHEIISRAAERFAAVLGYAPKFFVPGYGSANDSTYGILETLGFTHGGLSMVGRVLPECASVWDGAPLGLHYAHRYNRLLPGDMEFVEIPITADPDSKMWGGKHAQDLRVELVDAKNHWYTLKKAFDRQRGEADGAIKYFNMLTHNCFDYSDPRDFRRQTLVKMVEGARQIVTDGGGELLAATSQQLAEIFRRRCPRTEVETSLTLDTRGRS